MMYFQHQCLFHIFLFTLLLFHGSSDAVGNPVAGQVYTLQCGNVNATWKYANGTDVTTDSNTSISNGNLTFNPLLTSHGGKYICGTSTFDVTVQIPPPNVSIMFTQPGVSYYGSQTNISCVLAISPAVNSPVMINLWLIGPQGQIKFDARNMITEPQVLTDYRTTLQISSLNTNDGGLYQCVGNIFSNSSNIVASINASANITLSVQALPPPVVTTSSYGSTIAGSVYSLVCMVKVVDGLVVVPDVVWMKDGRVLVNRTNTTLTRTVSGGNSTLNLTFNPLLTSHGGQYICVSQLFHNVTTSTAVSVSVQIPLPSATIVSVSPGSLVVSGIPISIFCTFSIPSVVDTSVMVKTFWIRLNQTLNNGDRIKISTSQSMVAYNTTLQITPLNISDTGMYQCVGSISSNSSYVFGASNALANISLNVQALPPPVVTTSSYGSTIAGLVYSLQCMVKVVDGLIVVPDVVWMKDGRVLVNRTNTTLTRTVSGGNSTLNLTFNPLLTSHGGQYTCVATISVPQLSLNITNSSAVTVSVQIPVPNVTLSPVPLGSSVYTGTSNSISCAFTVPSVVDSPVMLKTLWIGPQGPIYNGNRTMTTITQSLMVYIATLQINPSNTSDTGIYWCVGNISSNSSYIVTSSNASANTSLMVQALPPPVVTTSSYGSTIAGSVYSLVCMVKVVDGLVVVPDVVWMKDGGVLVNGTNTTLTRTVSGGNSTLNLTFNPLLTSHGGQFTCVATISVPQLSLNINNSSAVTVSIQIPLPSATIVSVSPGSLVVSGIPISIFCTFSIPSVVDTSVMVKTFWIRLNQTLNNGDKIKISTSQSMAAHNTTLQINPVNISDTGMYQCVGSISSNSSYVVGSRNTSANITLSVQALPPPVVTTSSYGSAIAGSVYSLVCMVKVVDGLVVVPNVVWMKNGSVLVNGTNTTLTRTVSGGNRTLNLTFNRLLTSHGGQYTCVATTSVPQLSLNITISSAVTVSVQVPVPSVTLSPVPLGSSVYTGTSNSISCVFTVPSVVDSPVMLKTLWIGPQGPIYNGNRTMTTITQSLMVYIATLQINPSNTSDTGIYWCVGNISSNSSYIVTSSNASANTSLTVQALPPPVVTTSSYGSTIAGSVYSLVCMVKVVDGLVVVPDVVWMKDGGALVNGTNTTLTRTVSGGNSTLNLTFNPLLTSHGGQYTCVATISIPIISLYNVSNLSSVNTTVNIARPAVPITVTPSGGSLVAGTKVAITCSVIFSSSVDTEVRVNVTWRKNSTGAVGANDSITYVDNVTYVLEYHNLNNHTSSVEFFPVGSGDSGAYTCVITLQSLAPYTMLLASSLNNVSDLLINPLRNPMVSIVNSTYPYAINQPYFLTCQVMADDGLVVPINITWTKINGMNMEILSVSGNSNISTLTFSSLSLNDSALYSCTADISFPRKSIANSASAFADISLKPPDMVTSAEASVISEREMSIKWDQPRFINGALKSYVVIFSVLEDYGVLYSSTTYELGPSTTTYNASGLGAGVPYMVCVGATNFAGSGGKWCAVLFTKELAATVVPDNVAVQRSPDGLSMNVSWTPVSLAKARGFPLYVVSYGPQNSLKKRRAVMQAFSNGSFAVISGLDPRQSYSVTLSVNTMAGSISSNMSVTSMSPIESGPSTIIYGVIGGVIAGVVVFTLMIIIIVIYCIVHFRNQHRLSITSGKGNMYELDDKGPPEQIKYIDESPVDNVCPPKPPSPQYEMTGTLVSDHERMNPISVLSFRDHVMEMHVERDKAFEREFQLLDVDVGRVGPQSVALLPCNLTKNRFNNILPYDATRVVLQEIPNVEGSDYINASFINGYHQQKFYIAAQGPMVSTLNDFWRMIWEQRVQTIVMLTKCFEDGKHKCEQYWADDIGQDLVTTNFTVTTTATDTFSDFIVRTLTLKHNTLKSAPHLVITQYNFTAWPDHGVPKNSYTLVSFIQRVQKLYNKKSSAPKLVHCSAGVGRTGTFILLDMMLEKMKEEDSIDVYAALCKLRRCRVKMVQTLDQYVFIHDTLLDYITCGDTSISASSLRNKINKMSKVAPGNAMSIYEQQFQLIEHVSKRSSIDCTDGAKHFNASKNRYQDKLPYNMKRAYLRQSTTDGSDYINASIVPGYKGAKSYIAVQAPLEKTVNDFWRLLLEFKSKVIVMLCQLTEEGVESSYCYWPTTEKAVQSYGTISVSLLSTSVHDGFVIRKFDIQEEKARKQDFIVTQFHFTEWSIHGKPSDSSAMLMLLDMVNKAKINNGKAPITVTCNDGMGRTGAFVCIDCELERLKNEGIVDIFQFVKSSRCCRPFLVENVAQYAYCHEILADYVESMDTYSNF